VLIASFVILNNEYLHLLSYEKLTLDVFFLGYSFPVSLITMSVMFHFMDERRSRLIAILEEYSFWAVNLGVITFFLFIILGILPGEMVASSTLFVTVLLIFWLFLTRAPSVQQKAFLLSGMGFLVWTAVTGVAYIAYYFYPGLAPLEEYMLVLHATVALYGWNLSGLFVIVRWDDFPIRLSSGRVILLHWATVFLLAPLGKYLLPAALLALPAYAVLLVLAFTVRRRSEAP